MRFCSFGFLIIMAALFCSCNSGDIVLPNFPSTIFSANSKMTHQKDTIISSGDTIWLAAQGQIADTNNTYPITATLKATDPSSVTISGLYIKKVIAKYDTAGNATSGLFHWTAKFAFPIPAIPPKTIITSSCTFSYGLSLSSELGNLIAADSKTTYAK